MGRIIIRQTTFVVEPVTIDDDFPDEKEEEAKLEVEEHPTRDDIHEQRESNQRCEALLSAPRLRRIPPR